MEHQGKRQRIVEIMEFLKALTDDMQDNDNQLTRKLIERVTVSIGRLTVDFKYDGAIA